MGAYLDDIYTYSSVRSTYSTVLRAEFTWYSTTKIGHDHGAKMKYTILFIQYVVTTSQAIKAILSERSCNVPSSTCIMTRPPLSADGTRSCITGHTYAESRSA